MDILKGLSINVAFLFSFLFLLNIPKFMNKEQNLKSKVIKGIIFGSIAILVMLTPFTLEPGAVFDTRSIIISVVGLMFSTTTALITAAFAIAYRIFLGGIGMYAGLLTIISSVTIGMLWRKFVHGKTKLNIKVELYIFGLIVHIFMLLSQFAFPYPKSIEVLKNISLIVIVIYPLATLAVTLNIINRNKWILSLLDKHYTEKKFKTLFNENPLGMIQFDKDGVIQIANEKFARILHNDMKNLIGLNMHKLSNKKLIKKLDLALSGEKAIYKGFYKSVFSGHEFPTRVQFSPLISKGNVIGGVGIIEDLTDSFVSQEKIDDLLRHDILTKLYNSITFSKYLEEQKNKQHITLSIAIFDINTFQVINESFGHNIGDEFLIYIAKTIKKYCSSTIKGFRVGGDEFAITMENTDLVDAESICNAIKDEIRDYRLNNINLNVSFGVATSKNSGKNIYDIYNEAFLNLHNNKIYDGSSISKKTIDIIMTTLFEKSKREMQHSERVGRIAGKLAKSMNLGTAFYNETLLAGKLHDIGKINISEETLDKPGKLSKSEWLKIKRHPESGYKILSSVREYMNIANIVLYHHERFDGSGYPTKLKGHDIPLASRIICIADSYDAMTQYRTYRNLLSKEEAIEEIIRCKGTQFDPDLVDLFLKTVVNEI
ncbi:diguanylate cyclase [Mycoplasmatota bacterium WC30]